MSRSDDSEYERLEQRYRNALLALRAQDATAMREHATALLAENTNTHVWYYGNFIHDGNSVLGLASLLDNDIESAKRYLHAAGDTPGSPQLNSFGPAMDLAQALLQRGERDAILNYLDRVARFWAAPEPNGADEKSRRLTERHRAELDSWKAAIQADETPELNRVGLDRYLEAKERVSTIRDLPIDDVIAATCFIAVSPSGERSEVTVEIGRPYWIDVSQSACPVAIRGMQFGRFPDMNSIDPFFALLAAQRLVESLLRLQIESGWQLYFASDEGEEEPEGLLTLEDLDLLFRGQHE